MVKRYTAQLMAADGDQWENAGEFGDLDQARRFVEWMRAHPRVKDGRVLDLETGEVVVPPRPAPAGLPRTQRRGRACAIAPSSRGASYRRPPPARRWRRKPAG
jgi:hypothetical protein